MHIALFTDGIFPYVIGGMQKHSYYLAKYFAKNKVDVDLYHFNQSKFDIEKLEFFLPEEKKYIHSIVVDFPKQDIFPSHYLRASYKYSERIFEQSKKNPSVDFIYAKGFSGWKLLEEKKKGMKLPPVGVNFHGLEMFQLSPSIKSKIANSILLKSPTLFNLKNADYIFSYGGKITETIKKIGIKSEKIIEIPAGIEPNWLVTDINSKIGIRKFIFIGRYERRKGIEELNAVINALIPGHSFEFHFIGPIPGNRKIISEKIKYWGSISDEEKIKSILQQCDILVCPSYSEGMPNVILEAMASGLSVIATNVGAVSLMVSEKNGWLLNEPSPKLLSAAIQEAIVCSDKTLLAKKKISVNKIKDNFLWDNIIHLLIEKIEIIIRKSQ